MTFAVRFMCQMTTGEGLKEKIYPETTEKRTTCHLREQELVLKGLGTYS